MPGTDFELDPVQGAFNIGCLVRWLDYNDTWLAAEWGHPSDNLGAILACADYVSRNPAECGDILSGQPKPGAMGKRTRLPVESPANRQQHGQASTLAHGTQTGVPTESSHTHPPARGRRW